MHYEYRTQNAERRTERAEVIIVDRREKRTTEMGGIIGRTESEIDCRISKSVEFTSNLERTGSSSNQSAELELRTRPDRGKSMALTGLPNREEARFPAVPSRLVYFTSWPCPKIVKEIKVACLPHNLSPKPFYLL